MSRALKMLKRLLSTSSYSAPLPKAASLLLELFGMMVSTFITRFILPGTTFGILSSWRPFWLVLDASGRSVMITFSIINLPTWRPGNLLLKMLLLVIFLELSFASIVLFCNGLTLCNPSPVCSSSCFLPPTTG